MAKYKISFAGWYIVEADSKEEALGTSVEDFGVEYAEYENIDAEELEGI